MNAEEATVNPDGSSTFETPPESQPGEQTGGEGAYDDTAFNGEDAAKAAAEAGIDPAIYLLVGVALIALVYYFLFVRKKDDDSSDHFFDDLDGEKFNLKLPAEVEEYYKVKAKCEAAGWEPGKGPPQGEDANASGPYRIMAQALMKRAMADIPMVTFVQKESNGMNKLYAQSMCSVNQWRAYQAAEALVSAEVDEVRAEADEIEPGWSGAIWRQAMQYHNMLKQRHEAEAKAVEEQAKKRKEVEKKVMAAKKQVNDTEAQELAAQKAAEELIKAEEREKESKKAFSSGGKMKKGFLQEKKGKKK